MSRILIGFASSHGQTEKIARAIGARLARAGHDVVMHDAGDKLPSPAGFDAVLLGSRLEGGRYARPIVRYAQRNAAALAAHWSGFFSVSMSQASPDPSGPAAVQEIIDKFRDKTGWRPTRVASFAGALAYTQYNAFIRFVMRRISAAQGGATDTSRDHEYTDWSAVDGFADAVVRDLASGLPQFAGRSGWQYPATACLLHTSGADDAALDGTRDRARAGGEAAGRPGG